ncbi:MAG: hypothetical protein M3Q07_24160, partial [Pseudobdellovibrionaceae bacterium]|nr:hypothetical protein [Pseudobdellovibrionaceae bacterium]
DATSGTIKLGNWSLKATCSAKEQSLIIRAAILDAKGNFVNDPITGRAYDFEHPNSLLIGGGKAVPLCFSDPGAGTVRQELSAGILFVAGGRTSLHSVVTV